MRWLIVAVGLISCSFWVYGEPETKTRRKGFPWGPPDELKGETFIPKKYHHRKDLSDWIQLDYLHPDRINTVRIYGFSRLSLGSNAEYPQVDQTFQFSDLGKYEQELLLYPACYRCPVLDVDKHYPGGASGVYLGIIQFELHSGRKVLIGVTKLGFILGSYQGNSHNTFYSENLALFTNVLIGKAGNYGIPYHLLRNLMPTPRKFLASVGHLSLKEQEKEKAKAKAKKSRNKVGEAYPKSYNENAQ